MPIEETASPIFLAPVAKNAAMLSVVPAITLVLLLKPKSISSEFLNSPIDCPGIFIFGKLFISIGN